MAVPLIAQTAKVSPPTRGAWIETPDVQAMHPIAKSPPTRGAWIETFEWALKITNPWVAPHAGGVD